MTSFKKRILESSRLDPIELSETAADWNTLEEIYADHLDNEENLRSIAQACAGLLQSFPEVHSVRWRVKNPNHLIDKIIRKIKEKPEKYKEISSTNYHKIITDLVGLRVLHLFKSDCQIIHKKIKESFKIFGEPIIFIRAGDGDPEKIKESLEDKEISVETHKDGYRSWHYITSNQLFVREEFSEIQVRTIYEEAWSEIDHRIKYPNGCPAHVKELLLILNRISGTADEMGDSIARLSYHLLAEADTKAIIERARDDALAKAESLSNQLEKGEPKVAITKEELGEFQDSLKQLKNQESRKKTIVFSTHADLKARLDSINGLRDKALSDAVSGKLSLAEQVAMGRLPAGLSALLSEKFKPMGTSPDFEIDPHTGDIKRK